MTDAEDTPTLPGYALLQKLGSGGMGEVYLARQDSLDRLVAVKILRQTLATRSADELARFEREALLMAEVSHPNILAVFDRGIAQGQAYLVMEYVAGGSLRDLFEPGRPMQVARARKILLSVGQAVEHLHRSGILHRDLKPENVLLDKQGHARVSDFGIAMPLAETALLAQDTESVGTVDYTAPEQRHRLAVDDRADQYALAVIAYEVLTGEKPRRAPQAPSTLNRELASHVDEVILRGLKKDPDERFPSTGEYVQALDQALARACYSPRRLWGLAAAVTLLLVLSLGLLTHTGFPPRGAYEPPSRQPPAQAPSATRPATADQTRQVQQRWAQYLQVDVFHTNSIGMQMALIPPGTFLMGSTAEEIEETDKRVGRWIQKQARYGIWLRRLRSEGPQHPVIITKPFYLATTEVTVEQFRAFVEATGYLTDAEKVAAKRPTAPDQQDTPNPSWAFSENSDCNEDCPVAYVSHDDAVAFCQWLSRKEGKRYRLPTEAEWEYACRAGHETASCSGDEMSGLEAFAWFGQNASNKRGLDHRSGQVVASGSEAFYGRAGFRWTGGNVKTVQ